MIIRLDMGMQRSSYMKTFMDSEMDPWSLFGPFKEEGNTHKIGSRTSAESPPVKAALDLQGRNGGPSRLPSRTLNSDERNELKELLIQIGVPIP